MGEKPKRPRPAKRRTLPPDVKSLETMARVVHRELVQKAAHLKCEPHDYRARVGFRILFDQRAAAFAQLRELDPDIAILLAEELGITSGVAA
jgi:hypothetical protein